MAVREASNTIPLALEASHGVKRTDYPTLNSVLATVQKGTGDPNITRFWAANNSLINAYVRAVSPSGVPTEGAQHRAREVLDTAWSSGQYESGIALLKQEMDAALHSPMQSRAALQARISGKPPSEAPLPSVDGTASAKPSFRYSATGSNGRKTFSNDGVTWFNADGSPFAP